MVAGVTVIVDTLESRFSLSREKLTCSSSASGAASKEVAGDVVVAGVLGGNNGLADGLSEGELDPGVRTMSYTSCHRGLMDAEDDGILGRLGDGGADGRPPCRLIGSGLCGEDCRGRSNELEEEGRGLGANLEAEADDPAS